MTNFVQFHCGQNFHFFARHDEEGIQAHHSDNSLCEGAEFNLAELLEDDLPQILECPWCLALVLDIEHIRKCSNYKPGLSREDALTAYSDPTERHKRDSLLRIG